MAQGDERPRYSIQQISAEGTATADYAELTIQFRILVREEQWLRVPLHLDQAVLRQQPQYQGAGEQFLHFEGDAEGYVLWIRGPAGQQQQVTLKMLLPLEHVGDETRLKLLAPRATASEWKLKVPVAGAAARVSEGATLLPPAASGNETEFTVLGPSGDFELTWSKGGGRLAEVPAVLEAVGAIASRIDSRGINEDATLSVKSYGAAFERFRVRLPPDAVLIPGTASAYTVVPVEQSDPAAPRQRLVEVRLARRPPARWKCGWRRRRAAIRPRPASGSTCPVLKWSAPPGNGIDRGDGGGRLAGPVGAQPRGPPGRPVARVVAAKDVAAGSTILRSPIR